MNDKKTKLILDSIKENEWINITELAKELKMPRTSLIYYVDKLSKANILIKKWGRVKKNIKVNNESTTKDKLDINKDSKKELAKKAAMKIEHNDIIYIDSGSTTAYMAEWIRNMDIIVYTNNIHLINILINSTFTAKIYIIQGFLYDKTQTIVGSKAYETISSIKFDKSFLGINSKLDKKYWTSNDEEQILKNLAISNSVNSFLIFDSSKIGLKNQKYEIFSNENTHEVSV